MTAKSKILNLHDIVCRLALYFVLNIIQYIAHSETAKNTQISMWYDLNYRLSIFFQYDPE